jgi:hypothetical protein
MLCIDGGVRGLNASISNPLMPKKTVLFGQSLHLERQNLTVILLVFGSWGSSVSIVSDYRLDNQGLIPGRDKGLFL